ncbi:hypothetical protein [Paenibacillus periandrae]|uniref:hypothetical protein n=1 Tax=Paenibacillus periandrae TaxID=1761741 RepID=UPI001F093547|nr:hypothetical protein [Paenibacillus periandrae]
MFFRSNKRKSNIHEIIIHAGMHKTGTTSIQETLFANAERLKEREFLYPACWPSNHSIPIFGAFTSNQKYFENIVEGRSKSDIRKANKHFLELFEQEAAESEQSKIIISGENISLLSRSELTNVRTFLKKSIGDKASIKVLISVRHPVPWLVSATQQRLKAGQKLQQILDEKMNEIIQNLFQIRIGNLVQVFGTDAVKVYRFEDSVKHECGPVGYFLEKLGYEKDEIITFNIVKANESISLIAAELLAFINEKCPIIFNNRRNEQRTREDINPLLAIRGPKFDISHAYKKGFLELAQDDLKWLKENFGIDFSYQLSPQISDPKLDFSPETVADINHAYDNLSAPLQELVTECLRVKIKDSTNPFNFDL